MLFAKRHGKIFGSGKGFSTFIKQALIGHQALSALQNFFGFTFLFRFRIVAIERRALDRLEINGQHRFQFF